MSGPRHEKLENLRKRGIDPFGERFPVTHRAQQLHEQLGSAKEEELTAFGPVSLAGRIMTLRHHGKTCFAHLQDGTGRIQLYARADRLGDAYALFTELDLGDFIGVSGEVFRTRTGELTVAVASFQFLAKALRPLPEKWHGLKDVEQRYRRRYVDLVVNRDVRRIFVLRSRLIKAIRDFLDARGYIEVETPMMQPIPGGAIARPFKTHHNTLGMDLYLRIAPELYLKRLIVAGFERVYEINRNFRNEGVSTQHNPEFTMLEFYQAYADYRDLMVLTEEMFAALTQTVGGTSTLRWGEHDIELRPPWRRLGFFEGLSQRPRARGDDGHRRGGGGPSRPRPRGGRGSEPGALAPVEGRLRDPGGADPGPTDLRGGLSHRALAAGQEEAGESEAGGSLRAVHRATGDRQRLQ